MIKQRTVFKPVLFKKVMGEFGKIRTLIEFDESAIVAEVDRESMTLYQRLGQVEGITKITEQMF